jgi:hypothetical protein
LLQIKAYQLDTEHGIPINIPEPPKGYEDYDEARLHFKDPQGMCTISYENTADTIYNFHYASKDSNIVPVTDRTIFQEELQTLKIMWNKRKHEDMERNRDY